MVKKTWNLARDSNPGTLDLSVKTLANTPRISPTVTVVAVMGVLVMVKCFESCDMTV